MKASNVSIRIQLFILLAAWFALPANASVLAADSLRDVVDLQVIAGWKKQKVTPSKPANDSEFLRRVSLDILGVIPTAKEAREFLNDKSPGKRQKLIDRLLAHPRFAVHQADLWDMVFFGRNPPGYGTRERDGFKLWMQKQFANNVPYDVWTRKILQAEGNSVDDGPPMFFVQYSRKPEDATEAITQKFLGVQLQCARCHDHPFDDWTQKDFYGVAAFFSRLQVVTVGKKGRLTKYSIGEKNLGEVLFTGPPSQQTPGKKGEPVKPKFPNGKPLQEVTVPKDFKEPRNFPSNKVPPKPKFSRKNAFAEWATHADNPYFARAAVNRIWGQLMDRGIVHPVDNLSKNNLPSHPELLTEMTKAFVAHKFDVKWLIREIASSQTYQLSSAGSNSAAPPLWFERARYRPLSAEELFESWMLAAGFETPVAITSRKASDRFKIRGITWGYMLRYFGSPNDGAGNFQGGMHEHLYLNNGEIHRLISEKPGSLYAQLSKSKDPWGKRVELLYLSVLSRRPSPEETKRFVEHLDTKDDPRNRLKEAIWTLMTCSEFRFNH